MIPSSLLGLIVFIAFLAPGFVATLQIRRKLPLFAAGQSQIQFVLWVFMGSLVSNLAMIVLVFLVLCAAAIFSKQVTLVPLFTKTIDDVFPREIWNVKIWHILIPTSYVFLAFIMAILVGPCMARFLQTKRAGFMDFESAWLGAFSKKHSNFVLAFLDNGYIVHGWVKSISANHDALISENRDIVLNDADVFFPDGTKQTKLPQENAVAINVRNIKILKTGIGRSKPREET